MSSGIQRNTVSCGPAREVVKQIPTGLVNMVITSPPYNVGVLYPEYGDEMSEPEYYSMLYDTFEAIFDVARSDTRVAVNVKSDVKLPYELRFIMQDIGYCFLDEIIWNKHHTEGSGPVSNRWVLGSVNSPSCPRIYSNHEHILVFHCGDKKRNDSGEITMDPGEYFKYTRSIWNISSRNSAAYPATFPIDLPRRLMRLYTYRGDVVLDPFCGSGTTLAACVLSERDYIGVDISEYAVKLSRRTVSMAGDLFHGLREDTR